MVTFAQPTHVQGVFFVVSVVVMRLAFWITAYFTRHPFQLAALDLGDHVSSSNCLPPLLRRHLTPREILFPPDPIMFVAATSAVRMIPASRLLITFRTQLQSAFPWGSGWSNRPAFAESKAPNAVIVSRSVRLRLAFRAEQPALLAFNRRLFSARFADRIKPVEVPWGFYKLLAVLILPALGARFHKQNAPPES